MTLGHKFIFLYIPKTGSSFTLSVFNKINKRLKSSIGLLFIFKRKKLIARNINSTNIRDQFFNKKKNQHTTIEQIPENLLKDKQVYSIIRNPLYGYISRYEYKHYANPDWEKDEKYKKLVMSNFDNFPQLTFKQYVDFQNIISDDTLENHIKVRPKVKLGALSVQFIQMFSYNPNEVFKTIDFKFFENGYKDRFFPNINFLNNEDLSKELYNTLLELNYPKSLLNFILKSPKKNVSVKSPYNDYLDKDLIDELIHIEWFLFEFFPDRKESWLNALKE